MFVSEYGDDGEEMGERVSCMGKLYGKGKMRGVLEGDV